MAALAGNKTKLKPKTQAKTRIIDCIIEPFSSHPSVFAPYMWFMNWFPDGNQPDVREWLPICSRGLGCLALVAGKIRDIAAMAMLKHRLLMSLYGVERMSAEEDLVERLRRRAARARDRYPDESGDPDTLVGGLIHDYEAAADEIQRMRDALRDLSRSALRAMLG